MYYPARGAAADLADAYVFRVSTPHKHAHDKQSHKWNGNENYLLWRMVEINRESKAENVRKLNQGKFPGLFCVLHEYKTSQQIAKIEQRTAVSAYQDKVEEEHKASHSLKQKEGAVLFKLEGKDHNAQSHQAKHLRYNIHHIADIIRSRLFEA